MDVARYAEPTGKSVNVTFPHVWRYRDYVIDSFNEDKPSDRFIQEQIAGDLLPIKSDEQWQENLIATGFLALGIQTTWRQRALDFGSLPLALRARRMAERGVRFTECVSQGWDHHRNLREEMKDRCAQIDRPIVGLLADLRQRDLLDDMLVIWAGQFGRTPHAQNSDGRDHNNKGTPPGWLAAASKAAIATAPPTNMAMKPSRASATFTTGTPPSSTCWGSTASD